MEKRSYLTEVLVHLVLIAATLVALYPVLWVISLALSPGESMAGRVIPWPKEATLENFKHLVSARDDNGRALFFHQLTSSLLVSLATSLVGILIATPAAYALARFRFVGKESGVWILMATQMFPGVASLVPLYMILQKLQLLDSRAGLVLVYATTSVPFSIMQLRSAFEAVPIELEEAAKVDGATQWQAFIRVVLPTARPAIAVTALFSFMSAWNELILAATLLSREHAFTLPVVLQRYVGEHGAQWGRFAAGAILVSIPVMFLFYIAQRHIIAGMTAGAVKG